MPLRIRNSYGQALSNEVGIYPLDELNSLCAPDQKTLKPIRKPKAKHATFA